MNLGHSIIREADSRSFTPDLIPILCQSRYSILSEESAPFPSLYDLKMLPLLYEELT